MASPKFSNRQKQETAQKKNVVGGNFSPTKTVYEKPAILKANAVLSLCLLLVLILSMASYLFVVAKENKVKELHSVTNKINYENIELQNKVDYLKSFYVLDDKVQSIDFLEKPEHIIEVKSNIMAPVLIEKKKKFDITPVPGF